jgi:hypothetical protein
MKLFLIYWYGNVGHMNPYGVDINADLSIIPKKNVRCLT